MTDQPRLDPTDASVRVFLQRGITGPVVMLNLLRFRDVADYAASPELAPAAPISGEAAYLAGMGHRTAALADTRLLPLTAAEP